MFSARVLCVRLNPPRAFTNGVLLPGVSLWFSLPSLLAFALLLLLLLLKKKEKNWCQTRKKAIFFLVLCVCESFFQGKSAPTHTHTKKKKLSLPCRFVFRPSLRSPLFHFEPRIQFGRVSSSVRRDARERDFAQFKAIFQTKKCGTKERRVSLTRARAHTLFKFFFVCNGSSGQLSRAHSLARYAGRAKRRSRSAALFARARKSSFGKKFKPERRVLFFLFSNDNVLKK